MSAHSQVHTSVGMSPAQAAQASGVSRWTVMRAIKSNELRAFRDNRNQWRISQEDLESWRTHTVRTSEDVHTPHTQEPFSELAKKLAEQTTRAEIAEALLAREKEINDSLTADRDHWRMQATSLINAHQARKKWWPW